MDIRKIKKLIELLHDTDVAEIEISEGEESVRISRGSTDQVVTQGPHMNRPTNKCSTTIRCTDDDRGNSFSNRDTIGTPSEVPDGRHLLPLSIPRYSGLY